MEMRGILALLALAVLCIGGTVLAASTTTGTTGTTTTTQTAAFLQVTDYTTVPATVYPGTAGYATLTIANTGSDTATGISVYYTYLGSDSPLALYVSDMTAGSSSQVTVPFKMPQEVANGLYLVNVDAYYTASTSTGQIKKTSISIPLVASQYEALEVTTGSGAGRSLAPGETLQLDLAVRNRGGVVNNLIVTTPQNSSFSLEGTTAKSVGSVPSNSSANVTVSLIASSTAAVGQYTIPLQFTYQDALGTTVTQTLYIGPVSILEPSTQFRLHMDPLEPTEVGSQVTFQLTIENMGTSPLTAIVDLNSTDEFIPLGVTRLYFEPIGPGGSASRNVSIGIDSSTSAGYYTLPLTVTLGSGTSVVQSIGIPVYATPTVTIGADTQPQPLVPGSSDGKVLIQISNTGNAAIRSVYVTAQPADISVVGSSDKFIGTLNVDDFATFQLGVSVPGNAQAGVHQIPVTVTFKDSNNQVHVASKTLEVQVSGAGAFGQSTGNSSARRAQQGVLFGLGWLELGAGALVLGVAAYLAYRHFRKKRKEVAHKHEAD